MLPVDINFYKVLVLPSDLSPNSIYFVENGDYAETYVTNFSGSPKKVGNSDMISEILSNGGVTWSSISGRPTSTPANIDNAVSIAHTHSNLGVLNNLSVGTDGKLQYSGTDIFGWETVAW